MSTRRRPPKDSAPLLNQQQQKLRKTSGGSDPTASRLLLVAFILIAGLLALLLPGLSQQQSTTPQAPAPRQGAPPTPNSPGAPTTPAPSERQAQACTGSLDGKTLYNQMLASVVSIRTPTSSGSGFIVRNGWIATNEHVVSGSSEVQIRFSNQQIATGRVRWSNATEDAALISVQSWPSGAQVAPQASWETASVGDQIWTIGAPYSLEWTLTGGYLSAKRNEIDNQSNFQFDAAISPGNSGGPLIDRCGRVIGIVTFQMTVGQNLNFARPIHVIDEGWSSVN